MIAEQPVGPVPPQPDLSALDELVGQLGPGLWADRVRSIGAGSGPRFRNALLQRNALALTLERLRQTRPNRLTGAECRIAGLAQDAATLLNTLPPPRAACLLGRLRLALAGTATLIPVFHLLNTARLQADRGFSVDHAGLDETACFDLLLHRDGCEMEMVCHTLSAEDGRGVHRGAWFQLADRIDPDLQAWLQTHPGRHLLKLTLPNGLKHDLDCAAGGALAALHGRITDMLSSDRRTDYDAGAMLRLDPLLIAAAQANELGLASRLRHEFGPEAHISVTQGGNGIFVMAARSGAENAIAAALRERLSALAPARFTGTRPGVMAMFIDDIDSGEWHTLHETLELEREARQFLTEPGARNVVAVTCASRMELFGAPGAMADGEMRFRNPAHPEAKNSSLAPSVLST